MKSITFFLMSFFILASCSENENPTESNKSEYQVGSIIGTIIDANTDLPVSNAFITTIPLSSTTESNEEGIFELKTVGPDIYDIIITHPDYFEYKEKIKVSDKITNEILFSLTSYESSNTPPDIPTLNYPANNSIIGSTNFNFRWNGTDFDNDTLKYDIYFSEVGKGLELIAENVVTINMEYDYNFKENTEYQWKVVAKDKYSQTSSEIAIFEYEEDAIGDLSGLLANWKFDGNGSDSGEFQYNGTEQNIAYVKDRNNNESSAAYFNGTKTYNSKLVIDDNLQVGIVFTLALWIKPDVSLGENSNIGYYECISKWGGSGVSKASWAFGINKEAKLFLSTYNNNPSVKIAQNTILSTDLWQHIAVVFNKGTADFYLNGKFIYSAESMQYPQTSSLNTTIGGRQDQLSSFHGAIDDVYIFSRALDETEIAKLAK